MVLRIWLKSLYRIIIISLTKDISTFFEKASKRRDLSDQSKTCKDLKKMREESSTGSLTDMTDDVFAESLKLLECIEILCNCLRNLERQTKDKQLIDLTESINLLSDKFKEYEEDSKER